MTSSQSLPEDEAKALYKRLVQMLPNPPRPVPAGGPGPAGMTAVVVSGPTNPQFPEKNTFNGADMLALARIAPVVLDDDLIAGLGRLLSRGHPSGQCGRGHRARV